MLNTILFYFPATILYLFALIFMDLFIIADAAKQPLEAAKQTV